MVVWNVTGSPYVLFPSTIVFCRISAKSTWEKGERAGVVSNFLPCMEPLLTSHEMDPAFSSLRVVRDTKFICSPFRVFCVCDWIKLRQFLTISKHFLRTKCNCLTRSFLGRYTCDLSWHACIDLGFAEGCTSALVNRALTAFPHSCEHLDFAVHSTAMFVIVDHSACS